jgi:hypothetical protein
MMDLIGFIRIETGSGSYQEQLRRYLRDLQLCAKWLDHKATIAGTKIRLMLFTVRFCKFIMKSFTIYFKIRNKINL